MANNELEELQALVKRTDKENPKPEDIAKMREMLDKHPTFMSIGEHSDNSFNRYIETVTDSALTKELLKRQIKEKRETFGYDSASIIEKMLIDQVILCYLRLNNIEQIHIKKTYERHSSEHGLYWDKRLNSAQRRFTKASESLAKVRKLLAEADLREQQARNKRGQSTLIAQKILENATK